eukprot:5084-Heterococcus_DN1.PRE.1
MVKLSEAVAVYEGAVSEHQLMVSGIKWSGYTADELLNQYPAAAVNAMAQETERKAGDAHKAAVASKVANWRDGALISGFAVEDHLTYFISTTCSGHSWQFEQGSAVIRDGSSKNAHYDVYNAAMAYLERNTCSMVSTLGNRRATWQPLQTVRSFDVVH